MSEQNNFLLSLQELWNKHQKKVYAFVGGLAVIIGGWFAYNTFIKAPKEQKAQEAVFMAQDYFGRDTGFFKMALDGDGTNKGLLYVIKNNGGTKAANLANLQAGICYLRLGEFAKAIQFAKDFSAPTPALEMLANGVLADASSELKKVDDAISYYKKAASAFPVEEEASAEYLWRAAQFCEANNKPKDALELYKEIKTKFPKVKQNEIDKYIYKLSIEKNDLSVN